MNLHVAKKIGTQLIQQLITKGKELGLGEILLFTSPTNEAAIKLYENEGFKRKGAEVYVNALKQMYPPESWYIVISLYFCAL